MKKDSNNVSPKTKMTLKKAPATSPEKDAPGVANPSFPQEYEEGLSINIRMVPQPLVKPKKTGDKK